MTTLARAEPHDSAMVEPMLRRWHLAPDGDPIVTHSSRLLPVRSDGAPAMLKIATEPEERTGAETMVWWAGEGAARVLAHDGDALLMERATGQRSLADIARAGQDDVVTRILCAAAARLHAPRSRALPPSLVPLSQWFRELAPAAARYGGILAQAAAMAGALLADQQDIVVLHGDIHHGNALDFGPRGWLTIDPKGLLGERTFDFVNILRNPEEETALTPGRFAHQVAVIVDAAVVERVRLLQWTLAFTGLSAAWILNDGDEPTLDLAIAELARAELAAGNAMTGNER
jgi:streptomycin 6-kinase